MSDYTWLRCGTRWHAFVRANLHPSTRSPSVCRQAKGYRDYPSAADVSGFTRVCANCLRVVERARAAANPTARLVSSTEMREARVPVEVRVDPSASPADASRIPPGTRLRHFFEGRRMREEVLADAAARGELAAARELSSAPFLVSSRARQSVEEMQEAVLAEVSAHVPKASPRQFTTLVASRIAVRELREELKAIEEGLSKRFVLAHRKLDTLEQVFEELAKEAAS